MFKVEDQNRSFILLRTCSNSMALHWRSQTLSWHYAWQYHDGVPRVICVWPRALISGRPKWCYLTSSILTRCLFYLDSVLALNLLKFLCKYRNTNPRYISDRIRKNMPAVDSKTVPVARSVLTTPLARRKPPTRARDSDFSSRGACQHRTFKHAQTTQQTQSITKVFGTQVDKSNWGEGVRARNPLPPPAFDSWPPASQQQITHALGHPPEPGLTEPPLGLESPARPGFGLRPNPGEKLGGTFLRIRLDIKIARHCCSVYFRTQTIEVP